MLVAITYDCWVVIVADKGCGQIGYRVHCHEVVNGLLGDLCRNKGSLEYLASCRLIKKKQQSQGASTTVCCLCTRSPHFQFLGLKPRRFPRVDAVKAVLRSNSGAAPVDDRNELRETHYCAILSDVSLLSHGACCSDDTGYTESLLLPASVSAAGRLHSLCCIPCAKSALRCYVDLGALWLVILFWLDITMLLPSHSPTLSS